MPTPSTCATSSSPTAANSILTDMKADKDWRETIRSTACARFSTVLGPGSDGYHEEHIHLDLEPRRNNYKICEWDVREPPPPVTAQAKEPAAAQGEQGEGVRAAGSRRAADFYPTKWPLPATPAGGTNRSRASRPSQYRA